MSKRSEELEVAKNLHDKKNAYVTEDTVNPNPKLLDTSHYGKKLTQEIVDYLLSRLDWAEFVPKQRVGLPVIICL